MIADVHFEEIAGLFVAADELRIDFVIGRGGYREPIIFHRNNSAPAEEYMRAKTRYSGEFNLHSLEQNLSL